MSHAHVWCVHPVATPAGPATVAEPVGPVVRPWETTATTVPSARAPKWRRTLAPLLRHGGHPWITDAGPVKPCENANTSLRGTPGVTTTLRTEFTELGGRIESMKGNR